VKIAPALSPRSLCAQRRRGLLGAAALLGFAVARGSAPNSNCYGTTSRGALQHGVQLPQRGPNFAAYSELGIAAGRTYVHSTVARIVVEAYAALEKSAPGKRFVYGETGWAAGGSFKPHRTHQNGLSVDFMVPVLDPNGRSVPLPATLANRYGYDLEFDTQGRLGELTIDFAAIAEHLSQLALAAKKHGTDIAMVILDPDYMQRVYATPRGVQIRQAIRFMATRPWVRHDDHYHVDFAVACQALK
jgi:penicillin-insensitive murein endopeptidase